MDVNYYNVPEGQTVKTLVEEHELPGELPLIKGLREMDERDVLEVAALYDTYMRRFDLTLVFSPEEVQHHLMGGLKKTPISEERFVWAYVVEVRSRCASVSS